jgi:dihydroorotase-like cyclic amidohydrolase
MTARAEKLLREAGRTDPGVLPEWRSREAELVATGTVALLARLTGARTTIAHVSSTEALAVLASEQRLGSPAVAETCPQYLFLREDEALGHGAFRKFTPPARIRSQAEADAMWAAFNAGGVHHLSTDHAPSTAAHKRQGDIWTAPFGLPGLDSTLPLMLDAALTGRTSLERVVEAYALAPARRYRLAGKGRIAPGADADLVLVDPGAKRTLTDAAVHSKAGWTPYAGRQVRGQVVTTMVRGLVVIRDGKLAGDRAGRFLPGPGLAR